MRNILIIWRKELRSYFVSPIAYILLVMFAVIFGFFFWNSLGYFVNMSMEAMMEGEQFPITGGVQGDGPGNSFVYIPSLKAVVAGDTVFDHVYFGVPKDKAREDWMKTLDQISALQPAILIPGHEGPGAKHDLSAIAFMKKYITDWDANVSASKDPAEMRAKVVKQYPGLGMEFTLNDRINAFFPDASKGK